MVDSKISLLKKNIVNKAPPIWLMRQAGRYLPEYMETRKALGSFLDLCYNPEKAALVTLQPIKRFDFDAAIIFADILLVADSLGSKLEFKQGEGPVLSQILTEKDLSNLKVNPNCPKLAKIGESISIVRANLSQEKDLIGFAGSPWTVATYMVEGKGGHKFETIKTQIYNNEIVLSKLIDLITEQTIHYLKMQIDAGSSVIKLFDSWSGAVPGRDEFYKYVIEPTKKIIAALRAYNPEITIIAFPKDAGFMYEQYIDQVGADVIAFDSKVPLDVAASWQDKVIIQGNLDPCVLLGSQENIAKKVSEIMDHLSGKPFIFNLGHGIILNTPIKNVEFLINYVRNYGKK